MTYDEIVQRIVAERDREYAEYMRTGDEGPGAVVGAYDWVLGLLREVET